MSMSHPDTWGAGRKPQIAVVIPCYKVGRHLADVVKSIGSEVTRIYVVDDACPEASGRQFCAGQNDPRVRLIALENNRGVGGAVMSGYRAAIADGMDVCVKIDGDGQMDPALLPLFVQPILDGEADYCKGNRFHHPEDVRSMPGVRLFGNAVLSFLNKASSGYWDVFDPTNGYTAASCPVLATLPLDKISERYFFETDLLFRLGLVRAVVRDIPMKAVYGDEVSNLHIRRILGTFLTGHLRNAGKRFFYNYLLRDFSPATLEVLLGLPLLMGGFVYGSWKWLALQAAGETASSGTVMLAALPIMIGLQLLLSALNYDVQNQPRRPLHPLLKSAARRLRSLAATDTD